MASCRRRGDRTRFAGFWPKQKNNPFTDALNKTQKYVASKTLKEPPPWINSTLLKGDVPKAVAKIKARSDEDLVVLGSGELVKSLKTTTTGVMIATYQAA